MSETISDKLKSLAEQAETLASQAQGLATEAATAVAGTVAATPQEGPGEFWWLFTIFVMACFVGFYVVWSVTPALHSPLMGVTNAISSVIIVGALIATGPSDGGISKILGFFAVLLAAINIFGGFIVTQRMLAMFKKKQK